MFHVPPSPFALRRQLAQFYKSATAAQAHKYGCLLAPLPALLAARIVAWGREVIPDIHLGPGGRELKPHVTIKYGFTDPAAEVLPALKALLARHGPIEMRLEGLALFEGNEDGEVLYAAVASPQLHDLNDTLTRSFTCYTSHATYTPHVTLAYLREPAVARGHAQLPAPFAHQDVLLSEARYSSADNTEETIPLAFDALFGDDKALSALAETTGAALVAPPVQDGVPVPSA